VAQIGHQYQKKNFQKIEPSSQLGAKKVCANLANQGKLAILK
jgi:hypothetical protein